MTKMVYTVIRRPKKDSPGRTDIGWKEDSASKEVPHAGFLFTSRTKCGQVRKYTAYLITSRDGSIETRVHLGDDFETRAQAAFAIWREYYSEKKRIQYIIRLTDEISRDQRRRARAIQKKFRATPEGMEEYRKHLNAQAAARRAAMTPEQKAVTAAKRKEQRLLKKAAELLEGMINEEG